ncbi:unnamed protein product [Ranitomeya imitator]|uniref:Uncharacterized protein n=1 Tax=Ranitomeya imitator TaxID=111125 RepID=A0ABN9KZZ3_9NEOB|nr:unnamed protein product [Ranitomeya imitator]
MIDAKSSFHLTLLNVCFSNLKAPRSSTSSRCSIGFYLTQKKSLMEDDCSVSRSPALGTTSDPVSCGKPIPSPLPAAMDESLLSLPEDIDMDVFSQLPEEIKKEIIQSPQEPSSDSPQGIQKFFNGGNTGNRLVPSGDKGPSPHTVLSLLKKTLGEDSVDTSSAPGSVMATSPISDSDCPHGSEPVDGFSLDCTEPGDVGVMSPLPKSIDVNVFSQLPSELQRELMSDWKEQKLAPKIQVKKSQDKAKTPKGQRPSSRSRPNNLLKYFKPS